MCATPALLQNAGSPNEGDVVLELSSVQNRLQREDAILVTVAQVEGSAPREPGAWMLVFPDGQQGTIGGGQLEWQLLAHARAALAGAAPLQARHRCALGPSLGQCCGGVVHVVCERLGVADVPGLAGRLTTSQAPVVLFGGGHVGQALVRALVPLPVQLTWIDSREGIFPTDVPSAVQCEHSEPVHRAVQGVPEGAAVVIMSFSHAEDLDIVSECLMRQRLHNDLAWVGLIGSRTKWASFRHRLAARGFTEAECDGVCCPIGLPGIRGKQPEVIAASVAAQLLQVLGL